MQHGGQIIRPGSVERVLDQDGGGGWLVREGSGGSPAGGKAGRTVWAGDGYGAGGEGAGAGGVEGDGGGDIGDAGAGCDGGIGGVS